MAVIFQVLFCSFIFLGVDGHPKGVNPHTFLDDGPRQLTSLLNPRDILGIAARLLYPLTNGVNDVVGLLVPNNRIPLNYREEENPREYDYSPNYYPRNNKPNQSGGPANILNLLAPNNPERQDPNEINEVHFTSGEYGSLVNSEEYDANGNVDDKSDEYDDEAPLQSPIIVDDIVEPQSPITVHHTVETIPEQNPSPDKIKTNGETRQRKSLAMVPSDVKVDNNANSRPANALNQVYVPVSNSPGQGNFFVPVSSINPSPSYPNNGGSAAPNGVWINGNAPGNVFPGNSPQPNWVIINPNNVNPGSSSSKPSYVPIYWVNNPGQTTGNPNNSGYYVMLANGGSGGNSAVGFVPVNSGQGSPANFVPVNGGTGTNVPVTLVPINSGSGTKIPEGYVPVYNVGSGGNTPINFTPGSNKPGVNRPISFYPANGASGTHVRYVPVNMGSEGNPSTSFLTNNESGMNTPVSVPTYEASGSNTPVGYMPTNESSDGPDMITSSYLITNKSSADENDVTP